jgi:hypothetical protein
MPSLGQQLIECWRSQKLEIPPGASIEQIEAFEQSRRVYLPQSARDYFQTVNGMGRRGHQFDDDFFNLWALEDVVPLNEEFESECQLTPDQDAYYVFADHSIGITYYAVRLDLKGDQRGHVIGFWPPYWEDARIFIEFPTFAAFLSSYLQGPMANCL